MWFAYYSDGSVLYQYDEMNLDSETLFKDIDQTRLVAFGVETDHHKVTVMLETGEIDIDGVKQSFGYEDQIHRLIYFRRVRQTFGDNSRSSLIENVGWQTTIQGVQALNIKRVVGINTDTGKIVIQCD